MPETYDPEDFTNALQMPPLRNPYADAIASVESAGSGGYGALGPLTSSGDRAYGRYQVMGRNVGPWTKEILGRAYSPEEFRNDPGAQDAVFSAKFGQYVSQYGNPQDAASKWFTGRPLAQGAGASDVLGTTGSQYVQKFNAALAGGQPDVLTRAINRGVWSQPALGTAMTLARPLFGAAMQGFGAPHAAMLGAYGPAGSTGFAQRALPDALAMSGLGGVGALPGLGEEGSLGIFAGKMAQNADLAAQLHAETMEEAGASPIDIWRETGWSRLKGGPWSWEIPTAGSSINYETATAAKAAPSYSPEPTEAMKGVGDPGGFSLNLGDWLDYPDLYKAHPDLKDVPVTIHPGSFTGVAQSDPPEMLLGAQAMQTHGPLGATLHEVEHLVQGIEGFPTGGSPNQIKDRIRTDLTARANLAAQAGNREASNTFSRLIREFDAIPAFELYHMLAGETVARNVETRLARNLYGMAPWRTEDVPRKSQLLLGQSIPWGGSLFEMGVPIPMQGSDGRPRQLVPVEGNPFEGGQ